MRCTSSEMESNLIVDIWQYQWELSNGGYNLQRYLLINIALIPEWWAVSHDPLLKYDAGAVLAVNTYFNSHR